MEHICNIHVENEKFKYTIGKIFKTHLKFFEINLMKYVQGFYYWKIQNIVGGN